MDAMVMIAELAVMNFGDERRKTRAVLEAVRAHCGWLRASSCETFAWAQTNDPDKTRQLFQPSETPAAVEDGSAETVEGYQSLCHCF